MNTKSLLLTVTMTALLTDPVFALDTKDDCYVSATELAKGITRSYKVYNKETAKVLNLELISETEIREYSLFVDFDGGIDSYRIKLENDSSYKCLLQEIQLTQTGG